MKLISDDQLATLERAAADITAVLVGMRAVPGPPQPAKPVPALAYLPPRPQQPQLLPSIDTALFLAERGVTGSRLAKLIPKFSRAVEQAYIDKHIALPPKATAWVEGVGWRERTIYQGPGDIELLESVFAAKFTPELDWIES